MLNTRINGESPSVNQFTLPLKEENNFLVYYAFEQLEKPLKDLMISELKKLGKVYLETDSQLSEKEKEEKVKIGAVIEIVFSRLIEEKSYDSLEHTKLPVMECSLRISSAAEIVKSKHKQGCILWSREKFLATTSQEFQDKTIKIFESMFTQFIKDYQQANPSAKMREIRFYLYS
jgi:hypothetical protein